MKDENDLNKWWEKNYSKDENQVNIRHLDHLKLWNNTVDNVREDLNNLYLNKGIDFLSNILKEKDIKYYNKIDNKNHRRVIRALEVIEHTGEKFSSFLNNNKKERYNHIQITLDCNRNVLYERINSRVDLMIKNGLLNEKTFMVTGKLNGISRAEVKSLIEENSGTSVSTVTKKLDFLIIGEKPTKKKVDKAKELKITILNQSQFLKMLNKSG